MKKALLIIIALSGFFMPTQAQNPRHYLYSASIHGGWTLKTNMARENVPAYYTDYLEIVKQGLSAGANICFNIKDWFGIGLHYDYFKKKGLMDIEQSYAGYHYVYSINNTYTTDFIALSLGLHRFMGRSHIMIDYLIGFMDYRESGNLDPMAQIFNHYCVGHCFAQGVKIQYDCLITKHFAVGISASYCAGTLSTLTYQTQINSTPVNMENPIHLDQMSTNAHLSLYF